MIPKDIAQISDSWCHSPFTTEARSYPGWYGTWLNSFKIVMRTMTYAGTNGDDELQFLNSDDCEIETNDLVPGSILKPNGWPAIAQCATKSGNGYFMNGKGRIGYFNHEISEGYYALLDQGTLNSWPSLTRMLLCLTHRRSDKSRSDKIGSLLI